MTVDHPSHLKISDAHVWVKCPGSIITQRKCPPIITESQNIARNEGKTIHDLSGMMIMMGCRTMPEIIGTISDHGVLIDDEIHDAAARCSRDVLDYCGDQSPNVESEINLDDLKWQTRGFCDVHLWQPEKLKLTVWELKGGHKFVDVVENWQLILYAHGLLKKYLTDDISDQLVKIEFRVVQPRNYDSTGTVRSQTIWASDLRGFFNIAKSSAEKSYGTTKNKPGIHCGDCGGRYGCDAFRRAVNSLIEYHEFSTTSPATGNDLSLELELTRLASEMIKNKLIALESQSESLLMKGEIVPGYMMENNLTALKWNSKTTNEDIKSLGLMFGIDAMKEKPLTPTQMINKGVDSAIIEQYAAREKTGLKLKQIKTEHIARIFSNVRSATHVN